MEPIKFEQANKDLQKPEGWTDEQCSSLPVFSDGNECISLWKMTWRERLSALLFGKVWLGVLSGETQPPVWLMSTKTIFPELPKASLFRIKLRTSSTKWMYFRFANASQISIWWFEITWRMPWLEEPKQAHYEMNYGVKRS